MAAKASARRALSYGMVHFVAGRKFKTQVGRTHITAKAPGRRTKVSTKIPGKMDDFAGRYAVNLANTAEDRAIQNLGRAAAVPATAAIISKPRVRRRRMIVGANRQANLPAPGYYKNPRTEARRRSAVHNGLYRTVGTRRPVRTRRDSKGRYAGSY